MLEDNRIVSLFWERNERAIEATAEKYGRYCYAISYNVISNQEDAEECVNDTYMTAWEIIPPHRPGILSTFLGKIIRRISLNKWRDKSREKRGGGEVALALDELAECIPSAESTERSVELKALTQAVNLFLHSLPQVERDVFVCRYWFLASVAEIGSKFGFTESKTKSMLFRTRGKLRNYLIKEGWI